MTKAEKQCSGKIKSSLKYSSRSSFDAESSMLNDWGYTKKDLFLCLKEIETKLNDSGITMFSKGRGIGL